MRDVIQEAIQAIEAEIEERQGLISKLRELSMRPAAVDRTDGIARPKWSAARRKRFNLAAARIILPLVLMSFRLLCASKRRTAHSSVWAG